MKTYTICQNCVWKHKPTMLTGYTIEGPCEFCGHFTNLAIVKRACYCEEIKKIYPNTGGHYCPEWDFMFIMPGSKEYDACLCKDGLPRLKAKTEGRKRK